MTAVLVVIGGLPGAGKSTLAAALAARTRSTYLRTDRIEQAVVAWTSLTHPVGPVGYAVAHTLAEEQLRLGLDVIVECVNPLAVTRDAWPGTATGAGAALVEAEVICSDPAEHRRRVESRATDVEGLDKPSWSEVVAREYEPWSRDRLVLDTAVLTVADAVDRLSAAVERAATR